MAASSQASVAASRRREGARRWAIWRQGHAEASRRLQRALALWRHGAHRRKKTEARVLEEIVELDPLDGEALILLGRHSRRAGELEKAIFYFERAASLEAYEADAKVQHAQVLVRQQKYEEALPLLRRAQAIKPRDNVQEYLEQVERLAQAG